MPDIRADDSNWKSTSNGLLVVGIAASAGGLPAILELFEKASCHKSMCFVLVTHLQRFRKSELAVILQRFSNLQAVEIEPGMELESCYIYVLPQNKYAELSMGKFLLIDRPPNGPNNCANVLFASLALEKRKNSIGVVLSGAAVGADGRDGIIAIKTAGGKTFAQDPQTAAFQSMPELSIETGYVDQVMSPYEIGEELSLLSWQESIATS